MQPIFIGTRSCGQGLLLNKRTCRTCCVVLCRSMQGRKTCARRQNKHAGPRNMCKKTTKTCTRQSSRGGGDIQQLPKQLGANFEHFWFIVWPQVTNKYYNIDVRKLINAQTMAPRVATWLPKQGHKVQHLLVTWGRLKRFFLIRPQLLK